MDAQLNSGSARDPVMRGTAIILRPAGERRSRQAAEHAVAGASNSAAALSLLEEARVPSGPRPPGTNMRMNFF